jgi:hypothetical protein
MNCPKCNQPEYRPGVVCWQCKFNAEHGKIEELGHIHWMLAEIDSWGQAQEPASIPDDAQARLRQIYQARQRDLEIELALSLPLFTDHEAQRAWAELAHHESLLKRVGQWLQEGLLQPEISAPFVSQYHTQVEEFTERLEGRSRPETEGTDSQRLEMVNFVLDAADQLKDAGGFTTPNTASSALATLEGERDELEVNLGLRSVPVPEPEEEIQPEPAPASTPVDPIPPTPPVPLRERLRRALLSERTLQAILFMGIFLLFSAAISFVIWGWRDFSPWLRVIIPTGFTAVFYTLGWIVRTRTALYRSGIALSAIAALLIPIDLYTVYVNYGKPPAYWAHFWLLTSVVSLVAYIITTLNIQSRFFGYLVGTASGSIVLAAIEVGHQAGSLSRDWYSAGLSGLAVVFIFVAAGLQKLPSRSRWQLFTDPLRYLALLTVSILMPLTFGWRYLERGGFDALHYALTVTWWLGGFIFGWGAVRYRSRTLGILAVIALPFSVYLAQAGIFDLTGTNAAWQAFGLAWLVPIYFFSGYRLSRRDDPVLRSHGRTAIGWGLALFVVAAFWSLTDLSSGAAAASSHAVLLGAVILATVFWRQPRFLYVASLFSFTTTTFALSETNLEIGQLGVAWISLALLHMLLAINLGKRLSDGDGYARPLVVGTYILAALALLPPFYPNYDQQLITYTLGNWLGLAAWGAYLTYHQQPGFTVRRARWRSNFHWFMALPLPYWVWLVFDNRRPLDFGLPLALAALAWGMVALGHGLGSLERSYRRPWRWMGLIVSVVAPIAADLIEYRSFTPGMCLLLAGLLYFADAFAAQRPRGLVPAGLVTAWGAMLLLDRAGVRSDPRSFILAFVAAAYVCIGLWRELKKTTSHTFLLPLYRTAHFLAGLALLQVYLRVVDAYDWTDEMRLWAAAVHILLGAVYGLYAWGAYARGWAHASIWLLATGGGLVILAYSSGQGRSAALATLIAMALVLAERGLHALRQQDGFARRQRARLRLLWGLYRGPLLFAGWSVSVISIGLALIRNLIVLDGGRIQQIWAVVGLTLITALYALSARLFRQTRFVWLAGLLSFIPWTILTHLGWFTTYRLRTSGFAASWVALAWGLFLTALWVQRRTERRYALPLKVICHALIAFSLNWNFYDAEASRYSFGLALGLYVFAAWLDHRRAKTAEGELSALGLSKYLFPAMGLLPVWSLYWLNLLSGANVEHYGILLLIFGPLGLAAGQWLGRRAPKPILAKAYAFPAYLFGYVAMVAGTLLVSEDSALLVMVLLYDALMMLVSARLFKNAIWVYPAALFLPLALMLALGETRIPLERHGWWLIGLSAVYLAAAWLLRRARLAAYGTAAIIVGLVVTLFGLIPSSQDQVGALWGYGTAAILYALTAFWLKKPWLLTPASIFVIVPYALVLQRSDVMPEFYGLALFPGAALALALAWWLDHHYGIYQDFPWKNPLHWPKALIRRGLRWWGLPVYILGFGLATMSPFFTAGRSDLAALNLVILVLFYAWGIYRFRLRIWLFAATLAAHLAMAFYLADSQWWRYPAEAWLRFMPVTVITTLLAIGLERRLKEDSPMAFKRIFVGWSRPLYLFVFFDIYVAQINSLDASHAAVWVTIIHALLLAMLASAWRTPFFAYISTTLGALALGQWLGILPSPETILPVAFAFLALGYGLVGYGLAILFSSRYESQVDIPAEIRFWRLTLQRSALVLSVGVLILTTILGFDVIDWTARAILGFSFWQIVDLVTVQMVIKVLSLLGLLYLAEAVFNRRTRLGYLSMGMLLSGWMLYAFFVQQWDGLARVQWYALPAGLYLLGISSLEWQRGNHRLARWLDYLAMILMLGTLFWQTLLFGWKFALLLGGEGLAVFVWGSARRLRRFFYAGIVAVMLATIGQLVNALQAINQWITFGIIGLLLVTVAIVVERKLEEIKAWQEVLEDWE